MVERDSEFQVGQTQPLLNEREVVCWDAHGIRAALQVGNCHRQHLRVGRAVGITIAEPPGGRVVGIADIRITLRKARGTEFVLLPA